MIMIVFYYVYEYSYGILWYFYLNKKYFFKIRVVNYEECIVIYWCVFIFVS